MLTNIQIIPLHKRYQSGDRCQKKTKKKNSVFAETFLIRLSKIRIETSGEHHRKADSNTEDFRDFGEMTGLLFREQSPVLIKDRDLYLKQQMQVCNNISKLCR